MVNPTKAPTIERQRETEAFLGLVQQLRASVESATQLRAARQALPETGARAVREALADQEGQNNATADQVAFKLLTAYEVREPKGPTYAAKLRAKDAAEEAITKLGELIALAQAVRSAQIDAGSCRTRRDFDVLRKTEELYEATREAFEARLKKIEG